ncbi:MAG: methyl-accepting chemotaxis protein [Phycisphaerales bacterium]
MNLIRNSLGLKLALVMTTLLLCTVGGVGATLQTTDGLAADGLVINLAGRQRMLTQKYTKESLRGLSAGQTGEPASAAKTRTLFESTLTALQSGGPAFRDPGMTQEVRLPKNTDAEIEAALRQAGDHWDSLTSSFAAARDAAPGSADRDAAMNVADAANMACLKTSNQAVSLFQAASDTRVAFLRKIQLVGLGVALFMFAGGIAFVRFRIIGPIRESVAVAESVASGDLTTRTNPSSADEVGRLGTSLNQMCENLRDVVGRLDEASGTVTDASGDLSATSEQLTGTAEETSSQATSVAAAVEEMATNIRVMSDSGQQMNETSQVLLRVMEELSASIADVSGRSDQVTNVTHDVAELTRTSTDDLGELGAAAGAIGKVIEAIQDIAEQTNLLALNATIEAARAGDAGKGFAVVASEVKDLARQAADASDDIRSRIEGIQASTNRTVGSVSRIADAITELSSVTTAIREAVAAQGETTDQIMQRVTQSSHSATELASGVSEASLAADEITRNITGVEEAARDSARSAAMTRTSSDALQDLSRNLKAIAGEFQV